MDREPAELEVALSQSAPGAYQVELRFTNPLSDGEVAPVRGAAAIDPVELTSLLADPAAYGTALAEAVFAADDAVRDLYARLKSVVGQQKTALRVRLAIASSAAALHDLRWELIADPDTGRPMATSERTPFSRFMTSQDWRLIRLRPKASLEALVAIAAADDLGERFQLAPIDLAGEVARVRAALGDIPVAVLGDDEPFTLKNLTRRLRETDYDILYLVCHGAVTRKGPHLWLQDDDGASEVTHADALADRLADLVDPPRLVVLASCESASERIDLAPLAPRLAAAGVSAVVAMQGKISMTTVEQLMPVFFRGIVDHGQLDRALAAARGEVRDRDDCWMPGLFLRLKSGRLWYEPSFGGGRDEDDKWEAVAGHVARGNFVPLLGPAVADRLLGPTRELARQLAKNEGFPDASEPELHRVTQYLSVRQDPAYMRSALLTQLHTEAARRCGDAVANPASVPLPKLLDAMVGRPATERADDPFRILADLNGRVYVSATADTLMHKSLKAAGKDPRVIVGDWRTERPVEPEVGDEPTAERPVVYHPFGLFGKNESLVLTEDDFYDYLIVASSFKLVPRAVRSALVNGSLLFLGFHLNDPGFRVLFRQVMSLQGSGKRAEYSHVGVQVSPDDEAFSNPDGARKYLESYFRQEGNIWIYWGGAADFLSELERRVEQAEATTSTIAAADDDWL